MSTHDPKPHHRAPDDRASGPREADARRPRPPALAAWLLERLRYRGDGDVLLGDMEEEFHDLCAREGPRRARRWYRFEVLRSLPGFTTQSVYWSLIMLANYFKTALRNLRREKGYALINVLGLAIGLACCLLLLLYLHDELTFDRFHARADRIYRVYAQASMPTESDMRTHVYNAMPLGPALRDELPDIEAFVRFAPRDLLVRRPGREAVEERVLFADSSLFRVFSFPLVQGDPATVLVAPDGVVLSEHMAQAHFGREDPVGQAFEVRFEDRFEVFTVTAVAKNVPSNSSIQFDIVLPFPRVLDQSRMARQLGSSWHMASYPTYVLLRDQADPEALAPLITDLHRRRASEETAALPGLLGPSAAGGPPPGGGGQRRMMMVQGPAGGPGGGPPAEGGPGGAPGGEQQAVAEARVPSGVQNAPGEGGAHAGEAAPEDGGVREAGPEAVEEAGPEAGDPEGTMPQFLYALQPLPDIHRNPDIQGGLATPMDPQYVFILGGIGLAILLLACINFMTLAVGRSVRRAREVGVRKAVGALRHQVAAQFWSEAFLMSALGLVLAVALAGLLLPTFNELAGKALTFDALGNAAVVAGLAALLLGTGLIAGSYPALVLSGFNPMETLKGRLSIGSRHHMVRALVVVQFAVSVGLVGSTLIMLAQIRHLRSQPLGFEKEQVVVIPLEGTDGPQMLDRYRTVMAANPQVIGFTWANTSFVGQLMQIQFNYQDQTKRTAVTIVDPAFTDLLGVEIVAGRGFDADRIGDEGRTVLVNEALVRDFGWTDPVGQRLEGFMEGAGGAPEVVGVVQDFNFRSLHYPVTPMVLMSGFGGGPGGAGYVLARVRPDDVPATIDALRAAWQRIAPDVPFRYRFLDDEIDRQYLAEERWNQVVANAALLAVVIAALGLFGLATLTISGRTKEIGIRKALGGSMTGIAVLLSKDFLKPVVIGIVLAAPVTYLVMREWLNQFAYRITPGIGLLALAGAVALVTAACAVGYQALKAARANPADVLRYE